MFKKATKKTACYVLSAAGLAVAQRLATHMPLHIYAPKKLANNNASLHSFTHLKHSIEHTFTLYDAHIFVCAMGICVRCIAPHLQHKKQDPAVLVCDEKANYVISVLSGHVGGANDLTLSVAAHLNATPIITTATDVHGTPAIDMVAQKNACTILDWDKIKLCNTTLLEAKDSEKTLQVYDPLHALGSLPSEYFSPVNLQDSHNPLAVQHPTVAAHWRKLHKQHNVLRLAVPALYLGIGCKRDTPKEVILAAIDHCLEEAQLEPASLVCLASVDIKATEKGLVAAAQELQLPLHCYPAAQLAEAPSLSPSPMAAQLFGLERISVSEGAALVAAAQAAREHVTAQQHKRSLTTPLSHTPHNYLDDYLCKATTLILPKVSYAGQVTLAVALPDYLLPE